MNQKPLISQSLSDKADERDRSATGRVMAWVSNALVSVGLLISAVLTTIYLMLLVREAAGLPDPYGYLFGFLVGIVAIVPAELAMVIWKSRLDSDAAITGEQRVAAVAALILAGIFSSLTTSSFFSYSLPQLFPAGYLEIAPTLNIVAIVGSWIVFLMAVVAYSIFSRQTQQNLAQAKAQQGIFDAHMSVIRSAGEAIRAEADNWINRMDEFGVFSEDAKRLIANSLNMEDDRVQFTDDGQRPALPAPDDNDSPGLLGRLKSFTSGGRDVYIVYRLVPGRTGWNEYGRFDSYQDAGLHVAGDAGNHPAGTKYRISSHGHDIALFEVDDKGHAVEERPERPPVPPPGYRNGRPIQEATSPAGPAADPDANKPYTLSKQLPGESAEVVGTRGSQYEAYLLMNSEAESSPPGTRLTLHQGSRHVDSFMTQKPAPAVQIAGPFNRPTPPQQQ